MNSKELKVSDLVINNQKEIKIGTLLFNTRYNIVGVVDEIQYRGEFDPCHVLWYSVDNDDDYYWFPDEVKIIDEKEFLARKLKNDERRKLDTI